MERRIRKAQNKKLENRLCRAFSEQDQFALELLLDPGFIDVSPNGELATRNQEIANVLRNRPRTVIDQCASGKCSDIWRGCYCCRDLYRAPSRKGPAEAG